MAIFPKERREYGLHGDYPRKLFDILELPEIWCTFVYEFKSLNNEL